MLTSNKVFPLIFISDGVSAIPFNASRVALSGTAGGSLHVDLVVNGVQIAGVENDVDAVAPAATANNLPVASYSYLFDGTNFDRERATNLANYDPTPGSFPPGVPMVGGRPEWGITHAPAVGVKATISQAALAANKHVCSSVSAVFCCSPANVATTALLNLRDGATGAGTIIRSWRMAVFDAVGGDKIQVDISGLHLVGTANTAMTLEFAAAPGAASFQSVGLGGYSIR